MSTDHQRYSTENQSDAIHAYADAHGMVIERTYRDEGKSGLDLEGRPSLQRLLSDVESGPVPFEAVLVFDVSRWGRFQNADEAAHYEYRCTQAGVRVIYVAEPFENDGSPLATIVKGVKRSMAAEYSRELSAKVFAGQCRLAELGFRQAGPAGFGLRRALIDGDRRPKGPLEPRERKSIQTDRVILVPGPADELDKVREIYQWFLEEELPESAIAQRLNEQGVLTDMQRPWTRGTVHQVLTNEKYVGMNVYARRSGKLKQPSKLNPPERWVRCDGAFEAIVSRDVFLEASRRIALRSEKLTDAQMLDLLRKLLEKTGELSGFIIDEEDGMPSSGAYQRRFGGLVRAYKLIRYESVRSYEYLDINRQLRAWRPEVIEGVVAALRQAGGKVERHVGTDLLSINGEWTLSVVLARCMELPDGSLRWRIHFDSVLSPDLTLACRLDLTHASVHDYYLIPRLDLGMWPRHLGFENSPLIDGYRQESLDALGSLAARARYPEAA
jgi:DNA invertase Pin-like site-specific DNA recombinase